MIESIDFRREWAGNCLLAKASQLKGYRSSVKKFEGKLSV